MSKTWLVTGSSSGIGLAVVEQLLERGDRVAATLRKPQALSHLKTRYGEQLWTALLDVNDALAIRAVVHQAFTELGRIDVVVSSAGYALFGAAEEASDEQIDQQLQTNLLGSIQLIRACLPFLRKQGGGRILQVSSEGGQLAYPNFSLYHASKWAIEGFVESVALEVAPFGIEFTLVEPGPTRTNFGAALVRPPAMAEYEQTPAGEVRKAIAEGTFPLTGDPQKMARIMLEIVDVDPAPRRLLLGSGAYERVRNALVQRLAELEQYQALAMSTEVD
ncbi:SDR family oxidoreductase [Pseudomonas sp. Fig-3]|jgi:NAD(P)-dependent dehydrogenase (short-subunit alcohol dehydrogenase family)|uniref:Short-chain dehydrogenase/reductase n=1 Tax=Pseudomonas rhizophila TaxID=2045200 RepID=A0ABN5JZK3_9PSED|nr:MULTISPECIES: SDR family oxidoreductase [Pseudomonas]AVU77602.1 short-chain dehydrogenase/reductase [Pseudomonas rhizophila]MBD0701419.1 short-chain dehydrogenase/reductase [Pseudomonas sp. PSB1]MDD2030643.1 SDR family oxidoreductase [Pseudomonas sp. 39167]MEA1027440.1 SDR family oxidoreductase [Pseudomonas sp. N-137]MXR29858.1 SDR family oxidoreductase [Pseudomonas sp. PICF6]